MVNDPFKALSHPIRRGIVERLAAGPATVGEATGGFGVSKPAISKHLKVLEETGVVKRVVEGRTHRLSLEPDVLSVAADWMDHQRALWGRMFDVVDEYLKEEGAEMNMPPIVSPQEWRSARAELLVKEKELTRARDALAAERRRMPRMAVQKDYRFEGPDGPASLHDLFDGRRQLIVYRFFFEPGVAGWPERGCRGCSMVADQVAHLAHLNARDTTLVFISRAPQPDIERWKTRMGWQIPWYTITDDYATTTKSSAPTTSTSAATRPWAAPGATSTSPPSDAKNNGRTHPKATPKPRPTCGGTSTTSTVADRAIRRQPRTRNGAPRRSRFRPAAAAVRARASAGCGG